MKKTSVTSEPLSAIHFSHIFSLQLFLWPFSCPLTPELNQLFVGYSFTLSEILDPFLLVSEVPAHVAQFDCYFINTFQLGGGGAALPIVIYLQRSPSRLKDEIWEPAVAFS